MYDNFDSDGVCDDIKSCLGAKLMRLAPISNREEDLLAELEKSTEDHDAGTVLFEQGGPADELLVLRKGWVLSQTHTGEGRRHIIEIHHPGDIIGISHLPFSGAKHTSLAASKVTVCRFARTGLRKVAKESPRLSLLMNALCMIENAIVSDRVAVSRRNDARGKMALFILQTMERLKLMNNHLHDQFHCPLSQQDIGDYVGLSMVHVSRMFTRLEDEKLALRHKNFIRILDANALGDIVGFANRYRDIDLDWLPRR